MQFVTKIEEKEYESFVSENKKSHFMQSYYWGEVMKQKSFIPHYVGIKEDEKIVATALLLEKKMFKSLSYFYCPRGYIMDYSNFVLLEKFTAELKKYAKANHAIYIKIDPDIKRHNLDENGNIDTSFNNNALMLELSKLGYSHKGFNTEFVNEQPRFTFRLNLEDDFENIYARMHTTTRKILNKKNQYDLVTKIGTVKDIPDFYITMEETAEREGLACNPIKYYQKFYEILSKHGMSDLYIVKADINKLKSIYQGKIDDLNKAIKDLETKSFGNKQKTENKINEYKNEISKVQKDFDIVNSTSEEQVVLSSIITVKYNDKVWTIHGGNTTLLRNLNSNYWLYYTIIKDAHDNGYKVIDFFGTSGIANPDKSNPVYGIHNFKKRLGGEYTEFIGEYDLICNKFMYNLYNIIIPIRRKNVKAKLKKKGN